MAELSEQEQKESNARKIVFHQDIVEQTARKLGWAFDHDFISLDLTYTVWRVTDPYGRKALVHFTIGEKLYISTERNPDWGGFSVFSDEFKVRLRKAYRGLDLPIPVELETIIETTTPAPPRQISLTTQNASAGKRAFKITVPKQPATRTRWFDTWTLIQGQTTHSSVHNIYEWLRKTHSHLVRTEENLNNIIQAGKAGLLEKPENGK